MMQLQGRRGALQGVLHSWRVPPRQLSTYEKKTPLEHILLRPGMYIGQTESVPMETWIFNDEKHIMEKTQTIYNPALLKIFDEILVNAADNRQRSRTMKKIDISVHRSAKNELKISVLNDGRGIPLEMHKKEGIYVPELIFGHLLTGSNFNDNESRFTGGSHGYGAKLTNIFSKQFTVEALNARKGIYYKQQWTDNMSKVGAPEVVKTAIDKEADFPDAAENYTKITFQPDLKRFGINVDATDYADVADRDKVIEQVVQMIRRRAMDIAACVSPTRVTFSYDNQYGMGAQEFSAQVSIPEIHSFKDYAQLFVPPNASFSESFESTAGITEAEPETDGSEGEELLPSIGSEAQPAGDIVYSNVNPRWEVAVGLSSTGSFENVSFVNNVWTVRGGTHVTLVTSQVVKAIETALARRGVSASAAAIRNKLLVLVNCKIENPMFDGQTKDSLNSKPADFGSICKLSDAYLKDIIKKSGIVESLLEDIVLKEENRALKSFKTTRRQVLEVPKLEDAHDAGGPRSLECTLILTEGDSAKALAVAGLEVVGREKFGVMPLRGKVINVRSAQRDQSFKNAEFINLCKALGLNFANTYETGLNNAGLRYGKVMIMCDQDTDGSHIKGLVINLFHHFWPALLQHDGFLQQFITPIVKAKSRGKGKESRSFYSMPEFKQWQEAKLAAGAEATVDDATASAAPAGGNGGAEKYTIKYYKGLGTNTSAEGREYFQALDMHRKTFLRITPKDSDAIDMAFNKERSANRKDWLTQQHDPQSFLDPHTSGVSYLDFIHKELIHFSYADIHRSIPSVIDGFKPSQRKVLFGCLKKKLIKEEAKVVQIAGYIAEHTAYHHGEASLHSTIINMAQDFVGSNNVPLLVASGQFGTRAQGGKDFASPRYVFTRLSPITRLLFPEEDDSFLQYEEEDGVSVEPNFYVPVIPTLLLNGSQGIGTGWSTYIPPYHLPDIVDQVRHRIAGTHTSTPLIPHVEGFKGTIAANLMTVDAEDNKVADFRCSGLISQLSDTQLLISELPPGVWTNDYKSFLCKMVERAAIKDFKEMHSTNEVRFEITASKIAIQLLLKKKDLLKEFKLHSPISMSNMHAFDRSGKICKYSSPHQIIDAHFEVRREAYVTRKAALERKFTAEELKSRNRSRFIASILNEDIQLMSAKSKVSMSETDIVAELRRRGFADEHEIQRVHDGSTTKHDITHTTTSTVASTSRAAAGFSYLLDMPIHSLTDERTQQLQQRAVEATERLRQITSKSVDDLWRADLDNLSNAYANMRK